MMKHKMKTGSRQDILEEQWDASNPKPLSAYSKGSHYKGKWRCVLGHTWETEIKLRYSGSNCPYCQSRMLLRGFNDLETRNAALAKEWHPTLNVTKPSDFMPYSQSKVWWKCKTCGHEWIAIIGDRSRGKGCPVCGKKKPDAKSDNLAVRYPDIAKEWDYEKNGKKPSEYRPHSNAHVWWKCQNGHSWSATINSRTGKRSRGCPYCAGKRAIAGETDLATTNPELAAEWDSEKNRISVQDVTKGSNVKVWWICPKGHHYMAQVVNRVIGKGCPICWKGETH